MEKRRSARRSPALDEPLRRMRLRTGRELTVVDVSTTGALVEGGGRLLPGTHVEVHVITRRGRVLVRSRVVRGFVHILTADAIIYRSALAFDAPVDVAGYAMPALDHSAAALMGSPYPGSASPDQA